VEELSRSTTPLFFQADLLTTRRVLPVLGIINVSFVVKIAGFNQSMIITPQYPVTVVNASAVPFSNRFGVSSELRCAVFNKALNANYAEWTASITNTGRQPIDFLCVFLRNDSAQLLAGAIRCAGPAYLGNGAPAHYGWPQWSAKQRPTSSLSYRRQTDLTRQDMRRTSGDIRRQLRGCAERLGASYCLAFRGSEYHDSLH